MRAIAFRIYICTALLTGLFCAPVSQGASVGLTWVSPTTRVDGSPLTEPVGHRVLCGTASRVYDMSVDVGEATDYTFEDLEKGTTYYFAAVAYNEGGLSSDYSDEAAVTIPPNEAPAVQLLAPAPGTISGGTSTITLVADATDADGSVVRVDFYQGSTKLGEVLQAPYEWAWTPPAAAAFSLRAAAVDSDGATTFTPVVQVEIDRDADLGGVLIPSAEGLVSVEAEDYDERIARNNSDWSPEYDAEASAQVAMLAAPNTGVSYGSSSFEANSPRLDYEVNFAAGGTYYVWIRGLGASSDDDTCHVGLNGQRQSRSDKAAGTRSGWGWSRKATDASVLKLTVPDAGTHTVNVWMYEDGFRLDKLVLTPEITFDPEGADPEPSARGYLPDVTLTAPNSGAIYKTSHPVTVTAVASDPDGTIAVVRFYRDGELVGADETAPYSVTFTGLPAGSSELTAVAEDHQGLRQTSEPVFVTATDPSEPEVTLTSPTAADVYGEGDSVTLQATASDPDGEVVRVEFYVDGELIGQDASAPYEVTWPGVDGGAYLLKARAIDDDGAWTDSSTFELLVYPEEIYHQDAGPRDLVVLEAEHAHILYERGGHAWTGIEDAGASNGEAMQAGPNTGERYKSKFTATSPQMDYFVNFEKPGRYYLWVRGRASSREDDYCHIGVDGIEQSKGRKIGRFENTWSWAGGKNRRVEVDSAGVHAVSVWMYDDGVTIDKIILTSDPGYRPDGLGPEETPQGDPDTLAPAVQITSPAAGTHYKTSHTVTVQTTATDPDGSVAKVVFYRDSEKVAEDTSAPFVGVFTGLPKGESELRAVAVDNQGRSAVSDPVVVTAEEPVRPAVALTAPTALGVYSHGNSVGLAATASDLDGSVVRVEFYANGEKIGQDTSAPYEMTWPGVDQGVYQLKARAIDNDQAWTDSPEFKLVVYPHEIYHQDAGPRDLVVLEAEHAHVLYERGGHAWSELEDAGASGGEAMEAGPNNGRRYNSKFASSSPQMDYFVNFEKAGRYYVWVRGRGASRDDDYCHVGIDGIEQSKGRKVGRFGTTWSWAGGSRKRVEVDSAGIHAVSLWMAYDGAQVDKIILTTDAGYRPEGFGPEETPQGYLLTEAPSVHITSPAAGAAYKTTHTVTMTATASDPDGSIAKVVFYRDRDIVAVDTSAPYAGVFTGLPKGETELWAVAVDNEGRSAVAEPVTVVADLPVWPGVALTQPTGTTIYSDGASVTLAASAWDDDGSIVRVEFYADGVKIGQDTGAPYGMTWPNVARGEYSLVARAIDNDGAWTDSQAVKFIVYPGEIYQQGEANTVVLEAENAHLAHDRAGHAWEVIEEEGVSGGLAMQAAPNTGLYFSSGYEDSSPQLDYYVKFETAGRYYLWVRGRAASNEDDYCHVGLDGEDASNAKKIGRFETAWTWQRKSSATSKAYITVPSAGIHAVSVWMAHDGAEIDKIILTTDPGYEPAGYGPAETMQDAPDGVGAARMPGETIPGEAVNDFDGDGLSDLALYDEDSLAWQILRSSDAEWQQVQWGWPTAVPVAADYDGDGRWDLAVYHPQLSRWAILESALLQPRQEDLGWSGVTPVPADYDGDATADLAVYDPETGNWFIRSSSTGEPVVKRLGGAGAVAVPGDYDGDGKADVAVHDELTGTWTVLLSSGGELVRKSLGGTAVPGDYDGDGKTDAAVYNRDTATWTIVLSATGTRSLRKFGWAGVVPVAGDYDGDGKADLALYDTASATWYISESSTGDTLTQPWTPPSP